MVCCLSSSGWVFTVTVVHLIGQHYAALFAKIGTHLEMEMDHLHLTCLILRDVAIIGRGDNNTLGSSSGTQFNSQDKLQLLQDLLRLSTGTTSASSGAKDAGGVTVLNSVTLQVHTHNYVT